MQLAQSPVPSSGCNETHSFNVDFKDLENFTKAIHIDSCLGAQRRAVFGFELMVWGEIPVLIII